MNQYRCETCKVPKNPDFPKWCPIAEQWVGINFPEPLCYTIQKLGCASHSDFQNQREKVLDELINWIQNEYDFPGSYEDWLLRQIYTHLVELRGEQ